MERKEIHSTNKQQEEYYYYSVSQTVKATKSNLVSNAANLLKCKKAGACYFYGDVAADYSCIVSVNKANLDGEITTLKAAR